MEVEKILVKEGILSWRLRGYLGDSMGTLDLADVVEFQPDLRRGVYWRSSLAIGSYLAWLLIAALVATQIDTHPSFLGRYLQVLFDNPLQGILQPLYVICLVAVVTSVRHTATLRLRQGPVVRLSLHGISRRERIRTLSEIDEAVFRSQNV